MPVKLDQVANCASLDNERLRVLVTETIKACGLDVANDGEVYSPAPAPAYAVPSDNSRRASRGRRYR